MAVELRTLPTRYSRRVTAQDFGLYGLRVRADVELEPVAIRATDGDADMTVSARHIGEVPVGRPEGAVLAEFPAGSSGPKMYWLVEHGSGYVLRFPGSVEYRVSEDLKRVTWVRSPGIELEHAREIFHGHVMALLLGLAGFAVFHSSGVVLHNGVDGGSARAVGVLGATGGGKSTFAALLVAAGAKFLTDDLLCVKATDGVIAVNGGCAELRLRKAAAGLTRLLVGAPTRQTLDERLALSLGEGDLASHRLGLLVFPRVAHDVKEMTVNKLTPREVALRLASAPRMLGWVAERVVENDFRCLSEMAQQVPAVCVEARHSEELGAEMAGLLMERVRAALWGATTGSSRFA